MDADAVSRREADEPLISAEALAAAEADEIVADEAVHPGTDVTGPVVIERIEGGAIAIAALVASIVLFPQWWWIPFAAFLVFDLSMLGYLRSTRAGAIGYNLVHNYTGPAIVGAAAIIALWGIAPLAWWGGMLALCWAFHVGVDRALGYGLKLPDAFEHTHLGWIGRSRR
ncbi:DUF4260 domain-containing protein [Microbacterium sp. 2FI]|uniref:DUF4260 domain-containing protein n=1 Tax=Microbacterium sp. 2FI TaxID=2502193 RepID=UPI002015EC0C|nr:DUF4260 domain-containing protein [Microbacterium sp. 2FI]